MYATLLILQSCFPRSIRRRRKNGDYDTWETVYLSAKLFFTSAFCLILGWLFYPWTFSILVFGGLLSLFTVPLALQDVENILRQRWLIKSGTATVGEVLSNEAHNFPDFGGYHTVLYKFVTNDGVEVQGKWEHAEKPFWYRERGHRFIIIYWPKRPAFHMAYESSLYEVDQG